MKKDNIQKIGLVTTIKGYDFSTIEPFLSSYFKNYAGYSELFLIFYDYSEKYLEKLTEDIKKISKGIEFKIFLAESSPYYIGIDRFVSEKTIVEKYKEIQYWCHVDVRDVIFQGDPGEWINLNNENYDIICTTEGVTHWNEDWNGGNLQFFFGDKFFELLKDCECVCAGVFVAKSDTFIKICDDIIKYRNYSKNPFENIDQQLFNILIYTKYKEVTKFATPIMNFAINLGTMKAIPLYSKKWSCLNITENYKQIRNGRTNGSFSEKLLYPEPIISNGIVQTSNNEKFYIVHQYDRIPPWREDLLKKIK